MKESLPLKTPEEMGLTREEWAKLAEQYLLARHMCTFLTPESELGKHWHTQLGYLIKELFRQPTVPNTEQKGQ